MKLLYNRLPQESDGNGAPYAGGLLFTYVAGSSTKLATYQDSAGSVAHANPIVLDADGRVPAGIFGTGSYKLVLAPSTDTDPPTSPIWTLDDVEPINEFTSSVDQWGASVTGTYVSGTQFTVLGDQTSDFHPGRRLKITDAGGTKFGVITASSFAILTTVTVSLDGGATLTNPLTSVNLSVITATDHAVPVGPVITPAVITADQNNFSPAGLASARVLRISTDARRAFTGMLSGSDGQAVVIHNSGNFPEVFKKENASSTAANRFAFGATLGGGQSMQVMYDATTARWRAVHTPKPIGEVVDFGGATLPEDCLTIDQDVSRTTYAALFNEVGTTWGDGNGSTTFGLWVGKGSTLVAAGEGVITDDGVDAGVDTTNDTLTVPSNDSRWITGMAVVFTLASGTVTGLTSGNTYYIVRASATTVKLASSLANAQNGTVVDMTAKSSPVWSITHTRIDRTLGEVLGEDTHAMSSSELLSHTHPVGTSANVTASGGGIFVPQTTGGANVTDARGGNAAMNITQPSAVVTRGIRYC